ncbi:putative RNA-binding protein C22E12.02 [Diplonema papillatum]|nr:putative RNA-binding protein C22E12.02 [Diplonema papillatum]WGM49981.1 RBM42 [Diplonema papillatum]
MQPEKKPVSADSIAARLSLLKQQQRQAQDESQSQNSASRSPSPPPKSQLGAATLLPTVPQVPGADKSTSPAPGNALALTVPAVPGSKDGLPSFGLAGAMTTTTRIIPVGSAGSSVAVKKEAKKKPDAKCIRQGGNGRVWVDDSLADWPDDDFRLFVGNIGNEVTCDVLGKKFSNYTSFLKAKVVRNSHTGKTRGYGFVSFRTAEDALAALREMEGKYIGQRPITLKKGKWQNRSVDDPKDAAKMLSQQSHKRNKKYHFGLVPEPAPFEPYPLQRPAKE